MSETRAYTAPEDEDPRIRAALDHVASILVPGEALECYAVQRRASALLSRRTLVIATTGRLIVMRRGLFGGFMMEDIRWQDLKDARLAVGAVGAHLVIWFYPAGDLALANQQAQLIAVRGLR